MKRVRLPADAPTTMYEVDCSALFVRVFPDAATALSPVTTHCFYFQQPLFWRGLVLTLAGGIDGSLVPTRSDNPLKPSPNRLVLNPSGIDDGSYAVALTHAASTPSIGSADIAQ